MLLSTGLGAASVYLLAFIILAILAATISWLVGKGCQITMIPAIQLAVRHTHNKLDDTFFNTRFLKAVCHMITGLVFIALLPICITKDAPANAHAAYTIIYHLAEIYLTLTFIWVITSQLNNLLDYSNKSEKYSDYHLEGVIQFFKLLVYFLGAIVIIALLFNKNPITLVAGLGAAATILMLIFKDSILGLVASIQLSTNKMIRKGDWIIIESKGVNGTVEEVNLITVKVRNFDNSVSMVPPYSLVSEAFQNWDCMHQTGHRRVKRSILIDIHSIHFTTPDNTDTNLAAFRRHAEAYLNSHPSISHDQLVMVRQLEPTAYGLPLEVWFYFNETEIAKYEQLASEVMEYLISSVGAYDLRLYQYSINPIEN